MTKILNNVDKNVLIKTCQFDMSKELRVLFIREKWYYWNISV